VAGVGPGRAGNRRPDVVRRARARDGRPGAGADVRVQAAPARERGEPRLAFAERTALAVGGPGQHGRPGLELRGGRGQGVLLVDGEIRVSQGAEFHGVVIARDDVVSGPGGGALYGSVMAADSSRGPGDHSHVGDDLLVRRSSCAATGALRRVAPLVPVVRRAWAPLP